MCGARCGDDAVHAYGTGHDHGLGEAGGDFQFALPRLGRKQDAVEIDVCGVEGNPVLGVDDGELVGPAIDGAAAVGQGGGDDVADVEPRRLGELERKADPVFQFLRRAGFDDGHAEV